MLFNLPVLVYRFMVAQDVLVIHPNGGTGINPAFQNCLYELAEKKKYDDTLGNVAQLTVRQWCPDLTEEFQHIIYDGIKWISFQAQPEFYSNADVEALENRLNQHQKRLETLRKYQQ